MARTFAEAFNSVLGRECLSQHYLIDEVVYPDDFRVGPLTSGGMAALGMEWEFGSPLERGVFPEYYKETGPGVWSGGPFATMLSAGSTVQ